MIFIEHCGLVASTFGSVSKNAVFWGVATRSSEMSVFRRPTRRHIQEKGILHSHYCENLRSYITLLGFWIS
jgi:hypothetical protein